MVDPSYPRRAREAGAHAIIGGRNYGQGSSREHAALAPRYPGLRVVIARGFARIHWQNPVNFGVLPLTLDNEVEYNRLDVGDILQLRALHQQIRRDGQVEGWNATKCRPFTAKCRPVKTADQGAVRRGSDPLGPSAAVNNGT